MSIFLLIRKGTDPGNNWKARVISAIRIFQFGFISFLIFPDISAQVGKPTTSAFCSLHGNYTGWSCPKCASGSSGNTGGNNTVRYRTERVPSKKTQERNEKIDKANDLFHQAKAAAGRNDAAEALRLAKAAQEMANDRKWLKEWVEYLENYIAEDLIRRRANTARINGDAAYIRGDLSAALAFYLEALELNPESLSDFGKSRVSYIKSKLLQDQENERRNEAAINLMKQNLQTAVKNIQPATPDPNLNFVSEIYKITDTIGFTPLEKQGWLILRGMERLAKELGWTKEEQDRLNKALADMAPDENPTTAEMIDKVWNDMKNRKNTAAFLSLAKLAKGRGLPGAGKQSHQDCALYALANAANLPYEVVAARANLLISQGDWRPENERANPRKAIEDRGLNGGEVVMLAEAFGEVETVATTRFRTVIEEGRPVMINVYPSGRGGGHQVVLTKVFSYEGDNWYEMINSNETGTWQRNYISQTELNFIIKETGIAFRPEKGTVPKLLR